MVTEVLALCGDMAYQKQTGKAMGQGSRIKVRRLMAQHFLKTVLLLCYPVNKTNSYVLLHRLLDLGFCNVCYH